MIGNIKRKLINISGIVQGVGFRPFVYSLAQKNNIFGWIKNGTNGVVIDAQGQESDMEEFVDSLINNPPPLAFIERVKIEDLAQGDYSSFVIIQSEEVGQHNVIISPDVSICADCYSDINNPQNRRYRYPFTNCTNCGPRFTITENIPYDRINTVMKHFKMCPECLAEYQNPSDRRFHAQPISCKNCGPTLKMYDNNGVEIPCTDAIAKARQLLKNGMILAIKGLGGYHLACDAQNADVVTTLRKRKHRDGKPFALMAKDIEVARKYCEVGILEEQLLAGHRRPIVLLSKHIHVKLPDDISKDNGMLGIMLPYTPLHCLMFDDGIDLLVMTSGNVSGEPIYYKDADAISGLRDIADYFLIHDREIYVRTDDSVTSVVDEKEFIIRRSRGYVPFPIKLPVKPNSADNINIPSILACGSELKNTFCITKNNSAFISHHIGDLENYETLHSFEEGISHFERILTVKPQIIACDMHPEYLSTKYALDRHASSASESTCTSGSTSGCACTSDCTCTSEHSCTSGSASSDTCTSTSDCTCTTDCSCTSSSASSDAYPATTPSTASATNTSGSASSSASYSTFSPAYTSSAIPTATSSFTHARTSTSTSPSPSPLVLVQHHHAHIASCMAENGITEDVIGVAFDGTGYGEDGNIWGGEFFSGGYEKFHREAHFKYVPMPGGAAAIKEPWRMALSYLEKTFGKHQDAKNIRLNVPSNIPFMQNLDFSKTDIVLKQIERNLNCPLTSSAGRLFDAVSALLCLCDKISYEGQAAIMLEQFASNTTESAYKINSNRQKNVNVNGTGIKNGSSNGSDNGFSNATVSGTDSVLGNDISIRKDPSIENDISIGNHTGIENHTSIQIDICDFFRHIVDDILNGLSISLIASRFHGAVVDVIVQICEDIRNRKGLNIVALSGGVFQNKLLLEKTIFALKNKHFTVIFNSKVPTNDGGISYGQSAIALWKCMTSET